MNSIAPQIAALLVQKRRLDMMQEENNDLLAGFSKKNRRKLKRFMKKHKGEDIVIELEHK